jgi:hypothetical protein
MMMMIVIGPVVMNVYGKSCGIRPQNVVRRKDSRY